MIKEILKKWGYKDSIFRRGEHIHTCARNIANFQATRIEHQIRKYDNSARVTLGQGMFFVKTDKAI